MRYFWYIWLVLIVGCASHSKKFDPYSSVEVAGSFTNFPDASLLVANCDSYRLGAGDSVEIQLLGIPDVSGPVNVLVCADGKIYYDLLSALDVWGLTLEELQVKLVMELKKYYYRPEVVVALKHSVSQRIWMLGRFLKPGSYPITEPTTVLDSIGMAQGFLSGLIGGASRELVDLSHSFVLRDGNVLPVDFEKLISNGDFRYNVYLKPNDVVYVPSSLSEEVYVFGGSRAGKYAYTSRSTLVSVLTDSRVSSSSDLKHVAILRGSLSSPSICVVDYTAILAGRARDFKLQPRDIVYVPNAPYRTLERYANMIVATFVRTVAANEGGRAGSTGSVNVGLSNPLN